MNVNVLCLLDKVFNMGRHMSTYYKLSVFKIIWNAISDDTLYYLIICVVSVIISSRETEQTFMFCPNWKDGMNLGLVSLHSIQHSVNWHRQDCMHELSSANIKQTTCLYYGSSRGNKVNGIS